MTEDTANKALPYADSNVVDSPAKRGKGVFVFAVSLLVIIGAEWLAGVVARAFHIDNAGFLVRAIFGWIGIAFLLTFLISIPTSILALIRCLFLYFKCPRSNPDYLAAAFIALLTYFAVITLMLQQMARELPHGSDLH